MVNGSYIAALTGKPVWDAVDWCRERFGPHGDIWNFTNDTPHFYRFRFYFKSKDDAVLFRLRWL